MDAKTLCRKIFRIHIIKNYQRKERYSKSQLTLFEHHFCCLVGYETAIDPHIGGPDSLVLQLNIVIEDKVGQEPFQQVSSEVPAGTASKKRETGINSNQPKRLRNVHTTHASHARKGGKQGL
jgi:hypothetical protein